MTERITMGGMIVPSTAASMPEKPPTFQPTWMAALTAIGPGQDWAMAIMSIISSSSIQW